MLDTRRRGIRPQRGEVVVEDERCAVLRRACTARPLVSRTQITGWIVPGALLDGACFYLSLPWAGGAMRRHQDRLAGKAVEPAMWRAEHAYLHAGSGVGADVL